MKAAIFVSLIAIALLLAACSLPEEAPTPTAIPDVIPTPRIADTPTPPVIGTPTPVKEESASGRVVRQYATPPEMSIDTEGEYTADIQTNQGTITVELFAEDTPITVNNFVFLARQAFYDGVVFHRVIPNFMIQGGDPTGTGTGGPGYKFQDEIVPSLVFDDSRHSGHGQRRPRHQRQPVFHYRSPHAQLDRRSHYLRQGYRRPGNSRRYIGSPH